jgi:hypothetical protein
MIAPLLEAYPDAINIRDGSGYLPVHIAAEYSSVHVFRMLAEENMANLTLTSDDHHRDFHVSIAHLAVKSPNLDILRYIQSVRPELLLSMDNAQKLPILFLAYGDLTSSMSVASEILRFLLQHCRSIIPEKAVAVGSDPFGYLELYETLTNAEREYDLDLQYPRRLLLLARHPSLCLPEVLKDLNYSARRGALFLFFHHPNRNPNPPPPASLFPSSTNTAIGTIIFSRIRNGPGSKELIRTIIGFL